MKTSEEIIQKLLDNKYITASEAMVLLKDISKKESIYTFPEIIHNPIKPEWTITC